MISFINHQWYHSSITNDINIVIVTFTITNDINIVTVTFTISSPIISLSPLSYLHTHLHHRPPHNKKICRFRSPSLKMMMSTCKISILTNRYVTNNSWQINMKHLFLEFGIFRCGIYPCSRNKRELCEGKWIMQILMFSLPPLPHT